MSQFQKKHKIYKEENFNYHQREALWTKLFSEYVGGEEAMEKTLLDNFDKGIIKF